MTSNTNVTNKRKIVSERSTVWLSRNNQQEPDLAPACTASYIADITKELSFLADASRLTVLSKLLNLVRVEAEIHSRLN